MELLLLLSFLLGTHAFKIDDNVDRIMENDQSNECVDIMDSATCRDYDNKRWYCINTYENDYYDYMRTQCAKTCGFEDKGCPCRDRRSWCKNEKYFKYCADPQTTPMTAKFRKSSLKMRDSCKVTCNTCKNRCGKCDDNASCTNGVCVCNQGFSGNGQQCIPGIVDGKWSQWSEWSKCSKSCGNGEKRRTRKCDNPQPQNGGNMCDGDSVEIQSCEEKKCAVDGSWSQWGDWSECSKTCGNGEKLRVRKCDNPRPQHGGKLCVGDEQEVQACQKKKCPVDGSWSQWGDWSECSKTCGNGEKKRVRKCDNPRPQHGGNLCVGDEQEVQACEEKKCPVAGGWGTWGEWSTCSKSCGGGEKKKTRQCDSPPPTNGGKPCDGKDYLVVVCNEVPCSVNGGWSEWSDWSQCSKSCGNGEKKRSRTCDNPQPQHGGMNCAGNDAETVSCEEKKCPVAGGWGTWGEWSACSKSCGGGEKKKTRECDSPPPTNGGKPCDGKDYLVAVCNEVPCTDKGCKDQMGESFCGQDYIIKNCKLEYVYKKCRNTCGRCGEVDGEWSTWSEWGQCSKTCGNGEKRRTRTCDNPQPQGGGKTCAGDDAQIQNCEEKKCLVNGGWSKWNDWSECSKSCGSGERKRMRRCDNPRPQHGGNKCDGDDTEVGVCEKKKCPEGTCEDSGGFCDSDYARKNCKSEYVYKQCRKTCGKCKPGEVRATTRRPPTEDVTECIDKVSACSEKKYLVQCDKNPFIKTNCPRSCRLCTGPVVCQDTYPRCPEYRSQCDDQMIKEKCKLTCDQCSGIIEGGNLGSKTTIPPFLPSLQPSTCGEDVLTSRAHAEHVDYKRIVGGEPADEHRWIWQGMLFYQGSFKCGCTLITPSLVITAAHCVIGRNQDAMKIKMGYHDKMDGKSGQISNVVRIISHEKYKKHAQAVRNDIALIQVAPAFHLTSTVGIACLPREGSSLPTHDTECYLTGWGRTKSGEKGEAPPPDSAPDILQQVRMPVISNSECKHQYLTEYQFCGGRLKSDIAACSGDSGGPFVCKVNGKWVLEGMVSYGNPSCVAEKGYSVFTRVSKYTDWIRNAMKELRALP